MLCLCYIAHAVSIAPDHNIDRPSLGYKNDAIYRHTRHITNVLNINTINFQKTIISQIFFNLINLHASPTHIKLHTHVQQL